MKVMRKERILQKDHGDYVKAERDLLTAVLHPYIVTLRYSFQTPSKLYLVLDFLNGGHLFFNLYRQVGMPGWIGGAAGAVVHMLGSRFGLSWLVVVLLIGKFAASSPVCVPWYGLYPSLLYIG
jgi:serine/threonine protein kinase